MSSQAVLQVVILRDGLPVATEIFAPGAYVLGSGARADLRLDDARVGGAHATLYFQNGRVAIRDSGMPAGVLVNGKRVTAAELKSSDEVVCGPFTLRTRVLSQRPEDARIDTPPEVAALLADEVDEELSFEPFAPAPSEMTVRMAIPPELLRESGKAQAKPVSRPAAPAPRAPARAAPAAAPRPETTRNAFVPQLRAAVESRLPAADARLAPDEWTALSRASAAAGKAPAPRAPRPRPPVGSAPDLDGLFEPDPESRSQRVSLQLEASPDEEATPWPAPARPTHAPSVGPGRRGKPHLYCELYWGGVRREVRRFAPHRKKPVLAAQDESAPFPLWGFKLPEEPFTLAETLKKGSYRLHVPAGASVERAGLGGRYVPVPQGELEGKGRESYLTLANGTSARLTQGELSLVAYVAPLPRRSWANPLAGAPWLVIAMLVLSAGGFGAFLRHLPPRLEQTEAQKASPVPAIALRLMKQEPQKKEKAKKKLEAIKAQAKKAKDKKAASEKKVAEVVKAPPRESKPAPSRALQALAKLSAGPASHDVLSAADKLGTGGSRSAKNTNSKLAGLLGNAPVAGAGLGTLGLGRGGGGTHGGELLRGKGGNGIGALGLGAVGRGKVGGTVSRASARSISSQGNIDREGVARVVNGHLNEVHACYERALLREPGLAGKVVLEWVVGTNGKVAAVKTKSSTLRNNSVEACILGKLKTWTFPPARGGKVIITYPFLFNSVGF